MSMTKRISALSAAALMLVLILDGQTALKSASRGLALCLRTVIPSLFPFLFLCSLITSSLWGHPMPWLRRFTGRLGIPSGAESLLAAAFLGGYPAGAQAVGTCYQEGRLSRQDAEHLLPLCNNAGPAFLFGMAALQFPKTGMVAALWMIQILSVLFVGAVPTDPREEAVSLSDRPLTLTGALDRSVRTMATICGWIILFQILTGFLERWVLWQFPQEIEILIKGILELSSGCCDLQRITSISLRFLICTAQLSFGGLCVTMQTASVIHGLSIGRYLRGKLLQTVAALVLAVLYLRWGWSTLAASAAIIVFSPVLIKNNCRFSMSSGV